MRADTKVLTLSSVASALLLGMWASAAAQQAPAQKPKTRSTVPQSAVSQEQSKGGQADATAPALLVPSRGMMAVPVLCGGKEKGLICGSRCNGTQGVDLSICDGKDACKPLLTVPCSPYQCRDGSCLLSCSSDQDCAPSHVCRSRICLLRPSYCSDDGVTPGPGRFVVYSHGGGPNCYPYVCNEGRCLDQCGSTADCYHGTVCNAQRQCVPPSR
jgi:hypothetical protein